MIDPATGEIVVSVGWSGASARPGEGAGCEPCRALVVLLNQLTKNVFGTVLEAELTEHLGHVRGQTPIAENMRSGTKSKTVLTVLTVLTEIGSVEIEVPWDRNGSFEPVIASQRKRCLDGIDEIVLSLIACGLTMGEIAAPCRGGLRGEDLQRLACTSTWCVKCLYGPVMPAHVVVASLFLRPAVHTPRSVRGAGQLRGDARVLAVDTVREAAWESAVEPSRRRFLRCRVTPPRRPSRQLPPVGQTLPGRRSCSGLRLRVQFRRI
jgi:putative transposase